METRNYSGVQTTDINFSIALILGKERLKEHHRLQESNLSQSVGHSFGAYSTGIGAGVATGSSTVGTLAASAGFWNSLIQC